MTTKTKKPRWGLTFHLEQETKPDAWRFFEAYPTRSKAVAAGRKIVTGRWRVVEVASRVVWVHEPERRKRAATPPRKKALRLHEYAKVAGPPVDLLDKAIEDAAKEAEAALRKTPVKVRRPVATREH